MKHTWSKLPVALNLFPGLIEEGDSHEPNRDMCDGPQETDTENAGRVDLEIEPEGEMKNLEASYDVLL